MGGPRAPPPPPADPAGPWRSSSPTPAECLLLGNLLEDTERPGRATTCSCSASLPCRRRRASAAGWGLTPLFRRRTRLVLSHLLTCEAARGQPGGGGAPRGPWPQAPSPHRVGLGLRGGGGRTGTKAKQSTRRSISKCQGTNGWLDRGHARPPWHQARLPAFCHPRPGVGKARCRKALGQGSGGGGLFLGRSSLLSTSWTYGTPCCRMQQGLTYSCRHCPLFNWFTCLPACPPACLPACERKFKSLILKCLSQMEN